LSGTASNANALTTGRTIGITGDITYTSPAFNGTSDVTAAATLANSGVTSGTYGTSISVPTITVDSKGRITSASTTNIPSATSTVTGLLTSTDYQTFSAKQGALTEGSGISISGGTISATGITSANLSATAGITNGQLANSAITLGSTSMSLGGTYTSVTGLSSVTTGTLTATSVVTNTLKVTGGNYTSTGAVLTNDGTGNAIWGSSGLYTLNGITADSQTFSTTTTATSIVPSFTSSGTVHTLNIPLASETGTEAGLISKSEYNTFNLKQHALSPKPGRGISLSGGQAGPIGSGIYTVDIEGVTSSTITTVASSVLSATANNIASTLVQRDNNGGFAAGTITSTSSSTETLKVTGGSPTVGYVLTASNIDGTAIWQSASGGITGVGTITTTSYPNGATVSSNNLVLAAADGTNGGILTSGSQTIAGQKSFKAAVTNSVAFNAGSGTTIDFSQSNLAYTSASPGPGSPLGTLFTLNNMKDGGTYTLAVQGTTSGTARFEALGLSGKSLGNLQTIEGRHTVYTFVVMGSTFYYSMISEQF